MAVPKKRKSLTRRKRARAQNNKFHMKNLVKCSNCSNYKEQHIVCHSCGFYKGSRIIAIN